MEKRMNRRKMMMATVFAGMAPTLLAAQTPIASPTMGESPEVDTRARDLVALLDSISPTELVNALQETPFEAVESQVLPWVDFEDSDLVSSLGGAVILSEGDDISSPESTTYGAYIVYESAEIAYEEFEAKLGPAYRDPSLVRGIAGTSVWVVESGDVSIGTTRIGNVMLIADMNDPAAMDTVIDHLMVVASQIAA